MKKLTRIMVSVLVVAAIAACGASPRGGRSPLSSDSSKAAAIDASVDVANTDIYKLSIGSESSTVAISSAMLATNYGINIDVLGLSTDGVTPLASLSYLEFGIAVEKTTGRCGMYVYVDGYVVEPHFVGTNNVYSNTTSNITCTASDGVSTLNIQIVPLNATTATVMIIDNTYGTLFTRQQTFMINPAE